VLASGGEQRYGYAMNTLNEASALAEGVRPGTPWARNTGKKALVFYHIPKCAGTSFSVCLKRNSDHHRDVHTCHDWLVLHEEQRKGTFSDVKAITLCGHAAWGSHELFPDRDCYYVTFLRHPVDRLLSHYRQECRRTFTEISLEVFAAPRIRVGGLVDYLGNGSLDLAKHRLVNSIDAFGLVEDYERSLRHFARLYGLDSVDTSQLNRTRGNEDESESRRQLLDLFIRMNPDELRFYEFARKRFETNTPPRDSSSGNRLSDARRRDTEVTRGPNPVKRVQDFDPFGGTRKQVEDHVANQEYDAAIDLLESNAGTSFASPERLAELYIQKGDLQNASRWAAVKKDGFVHDFLRFWSIQTAIHRDNPQMGIILLLNKIAEFREVPTDGLDSSLNRTLYTLCAHLVDTAARVTFGGNACSSEQLQSVVAEILALKRETHCAAFWSRMQFFARNYIAGK